MLARSLKLEVNGVAVGETPMLVPAFSRKAYSDIGLLLKSIAEFTNDPILVSAYNIAYGLVQTPVRFGQIVFLDSGGYECSQDVDLANRNPDYKPKQWDPEKHRSVVSGWPNNRPISPKSADRQGSGRLRAPAPRAQSGGPWDS